MKNIKNIVILLTALSLASCSNFDDLNTNGDAATTVKSSLLATGAIIGVIKPETSKSFVNDQAFVSKYMSWGENSVGYNDFGSASFGVYTSMTNYQLMADVASDADKNAYEGLSYFLKAYALYNLTIAVGDIPYSEILQGKKGVLKPKYDTQKEVFVGILDLLDKAYSLLSKASKFDGDPVYSGDVTKWTKLTNAFELRVLINLSKKESDTALNVKSKFSEVYNRGVLMTSNDDNFQLKFSDKAGQYYPFYINQNKFYMYPIISTTFINILKKYKDYRMFYYLEPSTTKISSGLSESSWDAYIGVDATDAYENIKAAYVSGNFCGVNKRYIYEVSGEPFFLVSYSEQNFVLAEGALRGWISKDPSEFYNKAIRAGLEFTASNTLSKYNHGMEITESVISNYLNSSAVKLSGTSDENLQKIMEQKYISEFMQCPYLPYYDFRRTGYPVIPVNPNTNKNYKAPEKMPVRWLYPDDEFSYNKDNLQEALDRQYGGEDEVNKVMWLLK